MRRKSIGATSQVHEPMSTGAFLEFLTRLGCRDAGLRPAAPPALHGTIKLRLRKPSNAPQGQRIKTQQVENLVSTSQSGIQAPGACGPGLQGAWGPGPQGLGPGPPGAGAFSPQKPPKPLKLRFFASLLVGAWRRRGCRLKRLLRRWGPGGKRSRDTPPYPPPPPHFKGERKRVFTLSAFGNHPTRPPRSADKGLCRKPS